MSHSGHSLVRLWTCFQKSCLPVTCTWNNTDRWNWNYSWRTLQGNGCHLAVLAQTEECHWGSASPWVPCRPTFSASVEVPGTGGVPGLVACGREPVVSPLVQAFSLESDSGHIVSASFSVSHWQRYNCCIILQLGGFWLFVIHCWYSPG